MENRYNVEIRSKEDYFFESTGKEGIITKLVSISLIDELNDVYNLSLGNFNVGEQIIVDYETLTGNGDYFKIFNTVAWCIEDFLNRNPNAKIIFEGNLEKKTRVYIKLITRRLSFIQPNYFLYGITNVGTIHNFEENYLFNLIVVAKKTNFTI